MCDIVEKFSVSLSILSRSLLSTLSKTPIALWLRNSLAKCLPRETMFRNSICLSIIVLEMGSWKRSMQGESYLRYYHSRKRARSYGYVRDTHIRTSSYSYYRSGVVFCSSSETDAIERESPTRLSGFESLSTSPAVHQSRNEQRVREIEKSLEAHL